MQTNYFVVVIFCAEEEGAQRLFDLIYDNRTTIEVDETLVNKKKNSANSVRGKLVASNTYTHTQARSTTYSICGENTYFLERR